MTRELFALIAIIATGTTLIPLIYLLVYRKAHPRQNRILAISLCLSFIFDVIGSVLAFNQITNILPHNLYRIIAFPAIMWFYYETVTKRLFRNLICIFTVGFLAFALISALGQGLTVMNNSTWTLSSILITITSFFFVADLNLMNDSNFTRNQFHETNIILNTSLALYYLATILLFAANDYIFSNLTNEDIRLYWSFHNVLHVMKNIGITVAFYLTARSFTFANQQTKKN